MAKRWERQLDKAVERPLRAPQGEVADSPARVSDYEDLLGCIWLYIDWRYVTRQLTTPQKELFADAVDAWHARLNADDPDLGMSPAERWWRDGA